MRHVFVVATTLLALVGPPVPAQSQPPEVPSPASVLGYELGDWVTDYAGMQRYLNAVAAASSRVRLDTYGEDYEHRQLPYVLVSSPSHLERIEDIRQAIAKLTRGSRLPSSEVASIVEETPAVLWLNYTTDGNETAGLESALMMLYHLASSSDAETLQILDQSVVVITPMVNPSSHERWATWSNSFAALGGNPDPHAMEHNPPWGVLSNNNHYLVDLNRDAVWATQRESRALLDLHYRWNPVVFIDLHGEYDNFVGPRYQEPMNPYYTRHQREWMDRFGRAIGARFGARGWSYSPWETGTFYPGFWESVPLLNGSISFTFETSGGGSRGLRYRRDDGSLATLKVAAEQHFQASLAVLAEAARHRRDLMQAFADYFRSADEVAAAAAEKAFYLFADEDPLQAARIVDILQANQIEVYRLQGDSTLSAAWDYFGSQPQTVTAPAGTYVVPVDQPRARLILTMLRQDLEIPAVTREIAESHRLATQRAGFADSRIGASRYVFYDITAWSMPLTYGLKAYWTPQAPVGSLDAVKAPPSREPIPIQAASYGYLLPGDGTAAMHALAALLRADARVNLAASAFRIAGRNFPRGTLLIRTERNPELDLQGLLTTVAAETGVPVLAVDDPHTESGPSLGSDQFVYVNPPRIAVVAGDPVSVGGFGDLWFLLERIYGVDFTAIYADQLATSVLDEYDVLVLPDGWYGTESFGARLLDDLRAWTQRGGTLICLRRASRWATQEGVELARSRQRDIRWPPHAENEAQSSRVLAVDGAILRTTPEPFHYLTIGYSGPIPVLVDSDMAFETGEESVPVRFAVQDQLRLSGFVYEDSLARLAETPYLVDERHGAGHILLFLDDPTFRIYWFGLHRLLLNGLLLSPSF